MIPFLEFCQPQKTFFWKIFIIILTDYKYFCCCWKVSNKRFCCKNFIIAAAKNINKHNILIAPDEKNTEEMMLVKDKINFTPNYQVTLRLSI